MSRRREKTKSSPGKSLLSSPASGPLPAWLLGALLVLATLVLYWPATRYNFVNLDDDVYVTGNGWVLRPLSWAGVQWAFTTLHAGFWHPLTWLSYMLDFRWHGLAAGGYHLTNLCLHAASALTLFLLLKRMTGQAERAAFVAALFALHPLHVESVAWVAERKDVLCTFFGFLSLYFYAGYARAEIGQRRRPLVDYSLALFFFICGLMSKSMLVTWPVLMLVLDFWPLERMKQADQPSPGSGSARGEMRNWKRIVLEKVPFFALSVIAGLLTMRAEKMVGAIVEVPRPLTVRLMNAAVSLGQYLEQTLWPAKLAVFYPYPKAFAAGTVVLAALVLVGITVVALMWARRRPYLLAGWGWFLVTVLLVSGLIQVGEHARADRYTYIPLVGVFVMLTWGVCEVTKTWRYQRNILMLMGGLVLALCLGVTRQQLGHWANSEALFRHTLAVTRDNYLVENNLGSALADKGQFGAAIGHFKEAVRLKSDYPRAQNNLGTALVQNGRLDEGIAQFQEVIRLYPNFAQAYNDLASALGKKGEHAEAIAQLRKAISLDPDYTAARNNLGNALGRSGQLDEAITQFQEAIRLNPNIAEVHNNLGVAFSMKGDTERAVYQFQEALRLNPNYQEAHDNLVNEAMKAQPPGR